MNSIARVPPLQQTRRTPLASLKKKRDQYLALTRLSSNFDIDLQTSSASSSLPLSCVILIVDVSYRAFKVPPTFFFHQLHGLPPGFCSCGLQLYMCIPFATPFFHLFHTRSSAITTTSLIIHFTVTTALQSFLCTRRLYIIRRPVVISRRTSLIPAFIPVVSLLCCCVYPVS